MAANTFMAMGAGTQAVSSLGSAYAQSQATKSQGAYEKQQYQTNAELASMQSQDALDRGAKAASNIDKNVKQTVGAQRASAAAQGLDPNTGTASELQGQTEEAGALDQLEAKNNAWRESFGYKTEAVTDAGKGNMAGIAAKNSANDTLVTGGLQFLSGGLKSYYYAKGGTLP